MKNRRQFLQEAATLSIGGALLTNAGWANSLFAKKHCLRLVYSCLLYLMKWILIR